jgi:hypothetical protein
MLHEASFDILECLVKELGADVNQRGGFGSTAVAAAAFEGYHDMVSYLVEELGADVNILNNMGRTALYLAAAKGRLSVLRVLYRFGTDINQRDNNGVTPLMVASEYKHEEVVKWLVKAGADTQISLGMRTAANVSRHVGASAADRVPRGQDAASSLATSSTLSTAGTDPGPSVTSPPSSVSATAKGYNVSEDVIVHACRADNLAQLRRWGHQDVQVRTAEPLYQAMKNEASFEILSCFMKGLGADVNQWDEYGFTALATAAFLGYHDVIRYLVEELGADVSILNKIGPNAIVPSSFQWSSCYGAHASQAWSRHQPKRREWYNLTDGGLTTKAPRGRQMAGQSRS